MAFPASVLLQLSRQPQNEAQNWILGIVANGLLSAQCDDCVTDAAATPGLPGSLPLPRLCYWCWDGVMWGVCTMGWTTWRLCDCWCCLTGAAWMILLWQWFFCCLLSKLHGDRVTDAAATTLGSTEWTAGTTAWQLRDCWCCLTGADYISLDCVHTVFRVSLSWREYLFWRHPETTILVLQMMFKSTHKGVTNNHSSGHVEMRRKGQ